MQTMALRKLSRKPRPWVVWLERGLALVAVVNLSLVLFDLSYVPLRNFWLHRNVQVGQWFAIPLTVLPDITPVYDPYKGISPHRETTAYLAQVQALQESLARDARSVAVQQLLLEMQGRSTRMIDENPFQVANKTGTLEQIKDLMRKHMKQRQGIEIESAKEAFRLFWSATNFANGQWQQELAFFKQEIEPLIATNYYRQIGFNGEPLEGFWRIDLPFQIFFALEFLTRTYLTKRRHPSLSWREALLWRWYDLPLVLPVWRWLRIVPVVLRLQAARLLDLEPVRNQFSRGFVALLAGELLEVIAVQTINQIQGAIKQGGLKGLLRSSATPYVDINDTNEIEAIARKVSQLIVFQVLPKIKPDLEAILQYNLQQALGQIPFYKSAQQLPGLMALPNQVTQQLIAGLTQTLTVVSQQTYSTLAPPNPQAAALSEQLVQHFTQALAAALQDQNTLTEIQDLMSDFLEEFKINYLKRLSEANFEDAVEEAQLLSRQTSPHP